MNIADSKEDSYIYNQIPGAYVYDVSDCYCMEEILTYLKRELKWANYSNEKYPRLGLLKNFKKEKEHFKLNSQVFKIADTAYYLNPTSESISYPFIYEDKSTFYPRRYYDIGPVWRDQSKYNRKYFRNREIAYFFEAHGFFTTKTETIRDLKKLFIIIRKILNWLGLNKTKFVKRPQDDKFLGAVSTYAFDYTYKDELNKETVYQIASGHYLGSNFSNCYRTFDKGPIIYNLSLGFTERLLGVLKLVYKDLLPLVVGKKNVIVYYESNIDMEKIKTLKISKTVFLEEYVRAYVPLNAKSFNSKNFARLEKFHNVAYSLILKKPEDFETLKFKNLKLIKTSSHSAKTYLLGAELLDHYDKARAKILKSKVD